MCETKMNLFAILTTFLLIVATVTIVVAEDVGMSSMTEDRSIGPVRHLYFRPKVLRFRDAPALLPVVSEFQVQNRHPTDSVQVLAVNTNSTQLHSIMFQQHLLLPNSTLSIQIMFLPYYVETLEATIVVLTSAGNMEYTIVANSVGNPYRLHPYLGHRVPAGTQMYDQIISVYNPYDEPLHIREVFTTEAFLSLHNLPVSGGEGALTSSANASDPKAVTSDGLVKSSAYRPQSGLSKANGQANNIWVVPPGVTREVIVLSMSPKTAGRYNGYVHIITDRDKVVIPVELLALEGGLYSHPEVLDFGVLTSVREEKRLSLYLFNTGDADIFLTEIVTVNTDPQLSIETVNRIVRAEGSKMVHVATLKYTAAEPGKTTNKLVVLTNASNPALAVLEIPYRASVLHGGIGFEHAQAVFFVAVRNSTILPHPGYEVIGEEGESVSATPLCLPNPRNRAVSPPLHYFQENYEVEDIIERDYLFTNYFSVPIALMSASVATCGELLSANPLPAKNVAQSLQKWPPVRLYFHQNLARKLLHANPTLLPFTCWLELWTNISSHRIPLHIVDASIKLTFMSGIMVSEKKIWEFRQFRDLALRNVKPPTRLRHTVELKLSELKCRPSIAYNMDIYDVDMGKISVDEPRLLHMSFANSNPIQVNVNVDFPYSSSSEQRSSGETLHLHFETLTTLPPKPLFASPDVCVCIETDWPFGPEDGKTAMSTMQRLPSRSLNDSISDSRCKCSTGEQRDGAGGREIGSSLLTVAKASHNTMISVVPGNLRTNRVFNSNASASLEKFENILEFSLWSQFQAVRVLAHFTPLNGRFHSVTEPESTQWLLGRYNSIIVHTISTFADEDEAREGYQLEMLAGSASSYVPVKLMHYRYKTKVTTPFDYPYNEHVKQLITERNLTLLSSNPFWFVEFVPMHICGGTDASGGSTEIDNDAEEDEMVGVRGDDLFSCSLKLLDVHNLTEYSHLQAILQEIISGRDTASAVQHHLLKLKLKVAWMELFKPSAAESRSDGGVPRSGGAGVPVPSFLMLTRTQATIHRHNIENITIQSPLPMMPDEYVLTLPPIRGDELTEIYLHVRNPFAFPVTYALFGGDGVDEEESIGAVNASGAMFSTQNLTASMRTWPNSVMSAFPTSEPTKQGSYRRRSSAPSVVSSIPSTVPSMGGFSAQGGITRDGLFNEDVKMQSSLPSPQHFESQKWVNSAGLPFSTVTTAAVASQTKGNANNMVSHDDSRYSFIVKSLSSSAELVALPFQTVVLGPIIFAPKSQKDDSSRITHEATVFIKSNFSGFDKIQITGSVCSPEAKITLVDRTNSVALRGSRENAHVVEEDGESDITLQISNPGLVSLTIFDISIDGENCRQSTLLSQKHLCSRLPATISALDDSSQISFTIPGLPFGCHVGALVRSISLRVSSTGDERNFFFHDRMSSKRLLYCHDHPLEGLPIFYRLKFEFVVLLVAVFTLFAFVLGSRRFRNRSIFVATSSSFSCDESFAENESVSCINSTYFAAVRFIPLKTNRFGNSRWLGDIELHHLPGLRIDDSDVHLTAVNRLLARRGQEYFGRNKSRSSSEVLLQAPTSLHELSSSNPVYNALVPPSSPEEVLSILESVSAVEKASLEVSSTNDFCDFERLPPLPLAEALLLMAGRHHETISSSNDVEFNGSERFMSSFDNFANTNVESAAGLASIGNNFNLVGLSEFDEAISENPFRDESIAALLLEEKRIGPFESLEFGNESFSSSLFAHGLFSEGLSTREQTASTSRTSRERSLSISTAEEWSSAVPPPPGFESASKSPGSSRSVRHVDAFSGLFSSSQSEGLSLKNPEDDLSYPLGFNIEDLAYLTELATPVLERKLRDKNDDRVN